MSDIFVDVCVLAIQNRAGRFTQVVWKGSREIGIGRAFAENGQTVFVVCNYLPVGNVMGRFKENVFPPGREDTKQEDTRKSQGREDLQKSNK